MTPRAVQTILLLGTVSILAGGCRSDSSGPPAEAGRGAAYSSAQAPRGATDAKPHVGMYTSEGKVVIELWPDKAPQTCANFLRYVDERFYDGTIFHRVIDGFMIQGGGFTVDMEEKPTHPAIPNEASEELKNVRGTIAMARTPAVDSATSQFFINVTDNPSLDHRDESVRGFGYCVFGKVVEGMDVVDRIRKVPTTRTGPYTDVPTEPVLIEAVRRLPTEAQP